MFQEDAKLQQVAAGEGAGYVAGGGGSLWNRSPALISSQALSISVEPSVSRASSAPVSRCLPEACQPQPFHR